MSSLCFLKSVQHSEASVINSEALAVTVAGQDNKSRSWGPVLWRMVALCRKHLQSPLLFTPSECPKSGTQQLKNSPA